MARFLPVYNRKALQLLRRLLDNPEQLDQHIFEYVVSIGIGEITKRRI